MTRSGPLLLVEDMPSLQMIYSAILKKNGYEVLCAGTASGGMKLFDEIGPEVVLLDLNLPDRSGIELMKDCLARRPDSRFLVITVDGTINRAVEAMRAGAYDFLVKPFAEERLLSALRNARAPGGLAATALRAVPDPGAGRHGFIGSSQEMRDIYARISRIGRSLATVFISGESGTGKDICARAVHATSNRADGPFVPLNCGAIPSALMESEVFGHLRGAFAGAMASKTGAAAAADGGTLFLDEICEMEIALQTKLLRFLQTSTIQPVGAIAPKKVDVRIICATNRDPAEALRHGLFREDLYYRLHVVPIHLPPLRERGGDVAEIAEREIRRLGAEEGRNFTGLDPAVAALFRRLPWPGNVRQLLNVLRNAVVLHDGPLLTESMLPAELVEEAAAAGGVVGDAGEQGGGVPLDGVIGQTMAQIERQVIEKTIERFGGIPRAANVLGVSASTLYRKRAAWRD